MGFGQQAVERREATFPEVEKSRNSGLQVLETDEADISVSEEPFYLRVHQGPQFLIRQISAATDPIKGLIPISRMAHDLRSSLLQVPYRRHQLLLPKIASIKGAVIVVRRSHPAAPYLPLVDKANQVYQGLLPPLQLPYFPEANSLVGKTHEGYAIALHQFEHHFPYSRKEVNALMAVDVGYGKSGLDGLLELSFDLSIGDRWRHSVQHEAHQKVLISQSECTMGGQMSVNSRIVRGRPTYRQGQMEAHVQLGVFPGQCNRFLERLPRDHDACSGNDSLSVGFDDAPIDPMGHPEIIGIDDKTFHTQYTMDTIY